MKSKNANQEKQFLLILAIDEGVKRTKEWFEEGSDMANDDEKQLSCFIEPEPVIFILVSCKAKYSEIVIHLTLTNGLITTEGNLQPNSCGSGESLNGSILGCLDHPSNITCTAS